MRRVTRCAARADDATRLVPANACSPGRGRRAGPRGSGTRHGAVCAEPGRLAAGAASRHAAGISSTRRSSSRTTSTWRCSASTGAARRSGHGTCAFMFVGTGIGSAILIDGTLHHGHHYMAGEIGATVMSPEHVGRDFGSRGCLETLAGMAALRRRWDPDHAEPPDRWFASLRDAHRRGDARAMRAVEETATLIGMATAELGAVVDPSVIILGGSMFAEPGPLRRRGPARRPAESRGRRSRSCCRRSARKRRLPGVCWSARTRRSGRCASSCAARSGGLINETDDRVRRRARARGARRQGSSRTNSSGSGIPPTRGCSSSTRTTSACRTR